MKIALYMQENSPLYMEKNPYMCQKIAQNMYRITRTKTLIRVDKGALCMFEDSPKHVGK